MLTGKGFGSAARIRCTARSGAINPTSPRLWPGFSISYRQNRPSLFELARELA